MDNYEYGFITKCAEYGVDPRALIKFAAGDAANAPAGGDKDKVDESKILNTFSDWGRSAADWGRNTWEQVKNDPSEALLGAAGGVAATSLIAGILAATRRRRIRKQLRRNAQIALDEGRGLSHEDLQALLAAKGII